MRVVLQRVLEAAVAVVEPGNHGDAGHAFLVREVAQIGPGLLALVAFGGHETEADLDWVTEKVLGVRVFGPGGKFDLSVRDAGGEILVVSQFTLLAELRGGRRPDFARAAPAETARTLYADFVRRLRGRYPAVSEGVFGAEMRVTLVNDGPATFLLERGRDPAPGDSA